MRAERLLGPAHYAAHRNITGDSRSIFAAVLKGEQTFAFEPALELSQKHRKSRMLLYYSSQRCYTKWKQHTTISRGLICLKTAALRRMYRGLSLLSGRNKIDV